MTAVVLGPLVISAPRFAALVGLAVFLLVVHFASRKQPRLEDWGWTVVAIIVVGARFGYVAENAAAYVRDPLAVLYFWQGGFRPLWGVSLAVLYTLLGTPIRRAALPAGVAGLVAWSGVAALLTPVESSAVERPAVPLSTLAGETTQLGTYAAGRPLVVNLWAPWCPPCRRETPMIVEVANSNSGVAFALVDQGSSEAEVRSFLEERGLNGENVLLDRRGALGSELRAAGLPTTLFFAADGSLRYAHVGEISRVELERRVRTLLTEEEPGADE